MAAHRMPTDIFACEVDGGYLFLDLSKDRYFRVLDADQDTFRGLLRGEATAEPAAIARLEASGIISIAADGKPLVSTQYPPPARSLIESFAKEPQPALVDVAELFLLVGIARRAACPARLPRTIRRLSNAPRTSITAQGARDALVRRFNAARRFVPGAPNCLRDSLALRRFLARRGFAPDLVIGVKLHPFGAHCWLQEGETVLNDTVAGARLFTPVLVA